MKKSNVLLIVLLITLALFTWGSFKRFAADRTGWQTERRELQREIGISIERRAQETASRLVAEAKLKRQSRITDSLIAELALKDIQIIDLKKKNTAIIDSVSKLPVEASYIALQTRYPVSDTFALNYRFASPQVKGMHLDLTKYDLLTGEFVLTSEKLELCEDLVGAKGSEIDQFKTINESLKIELKEADKQIALQYKIYGIEQTRLRRNFWFATAAAAIFGVAALW